MNRPHHYSDSDSSEDEIDNVNSRRSLTRTASRSSEYENSSTNHQENEYDTNKYNENKLQSQNNKNYISNFGNIFKNTMNGISNLKNSIPNPFGFLSNLHNSNQFSTSNSLHNSNINDDESDNEDDEDKKYSKNDNTFTEKIPVLDSSKSDVNSNLRKKVSFQLNSETLNIPTKEQQSKQKTAKNKTISIDKTKQNFIFYLLDGITNFISCIVQWIWKNISAVLLISLALFLIIYNERLIYNACSTQIISSLETDQKHIAENVCKSKAYGELQNKICEDAKLRVQKGTEDLTFQCYKKEHTLYQFLSFENTYVNVVIVILIVVILNLVKDYFIEKKRIEMEERSRRATTAAMQDVYKQTHRMNNQHAIEN